MYVYVYVCLYKQMCLAIDRIIFVSFLCCFCFSVITNIKFVSMVMHISAAGLKVFLLMWANAENLVLHYNQFIYREGSISIVGLQTMVLSYKSLPLSTLLFLQEKEIKVIYCQVLTSKISVERSQKDFFKAELSSFCFPFHASKREFILSTSSFKQMEKLGRGK